MKNAQKIRENVLVDRKKSAYAIYEWPLRNDSSAPDPYQTLSTIYEHYEEFEKSLQYALIGAYLSPPDANEWERLANMSLELNDTKQAKLYIPSTINISRYSRVYISSDTAFFKILKKPSIVQE